MRVMRLLLRHISLIILMAAGLSATAKELPRYGVFVFSDECVQNNQSGDVGGDRITLLRFPAGDMAIYQYGAGPSEGPILAEKVVIDPAKSSVRIEIQDEWGENATAGQPGLDVIEGDVSAEAMQVTLQGSKTRRRLPRISGLPKPIPTCI
jgi:hypothetical protein